QSPVLTMMFRSITALVSDGTTRCGGSLRKRRHSPHQLLACYLHGVQRRLALLAFQQTRLRVVLDDRRDELDADELVVIEGVLPEAADAGLVAPHLLEDEVPG